MHKQNGIFCRKFVSPFFSIVQCFSYLSLKIRSLFLKFKKIFFFENLMLVSKIAAGSPVGLTLELAGYFATHIQARIGGGFR